MMIILMCYTVYMILQQAPLYYCDVCSWYLIVLIHYNLSIQHYLSYLNSVRVQDIYISTHSLLHYFDRLILSGGEGKSNGEEGYGRSLRYAVLNLATLHCRFGH